MSTVLLPQTLDGRTIHIREDQQEGMPPPGMMGGPMGPPGMMGGPMGMGMGMGGPPRRDMRERRPQVDAETRKTCQV